MGNRATATTGEPASTFSCRMQKRRCLIPPSPPPPPFNTHQPPAQLPGQRRVGFYSLPPGSIPFQRPSGLQSCPCITLLTRNCYLVTLHQEQSLGGKKKHSDLFYC